MDERGTWTEESAEPRPVPFSPGATKVGLAPAEGAANPRGGEGVLTRVDEPEGRAPAFEPRHEGKHLEVLGFRSDYEVQHRSVSMAGRRQPGRRRFGAGCLTRGRRKW